MEITAPEILKKIGALVIILAGLLCIHTLIYTSNSGAVRRIAPQRHLSSYYEALDRYSSGGSFPGPLNKSPEDKLCNVSLRLQMRKERISQVCRAEKQQIYKEQQSIRDSQMYQKYYASQSRVIVDTGAKIAICLQAKGGSTFWKNFFLHKIVTKNGIAYNDLKLSYGIMFMPLEKFRTMAKNLSDQNYTLYAFGRNPWNRLVSLYRQKIETKALDAKEQKYVKAACMRAAHSTFTDLLNCVIKTTQAGGVLLPDRHWEPLTTRCGLCDVQYDYIGKVEYMNEESNVILSTAGIPGNITRYIEDVRTGSIREVEQDRVSGRVDYKTYYQNIPSLIISQLRDIYQSDLDILGYPDSPL